MATVTSSTNIDVNTIVSQLVAIERTPIDKLKTTATGISSKISAYGQIQSLASAVGDAATALKRSTLWQGTTATSADAAAVAVSSSGGAASGSYNVSVTNLASAHSLASTSMAADALVGAGTLTLQLGDWSSGGFVADADMAAVAIQVDADDTLADVRDKLNAASGAGVTAAIVRDANGTRLTLTSKTTGETSAMQVTTTGGDLDRLAYNPPASTGTGMGQTQAATNANAMINGLPIESESNTLSNVLDGLTLTLSKPTTTPVSVAVSTDTASIKKAMDTFVAAYNALNSYLVTQTKYDEGTKTAATLQGDSTAVSMRNQFRSMLREESGASSMFGSLSSVGFNVAQDGRLSIDNAKLDKGFANLGELSKLFSNVDDAVPAKNGMAERFRLLANSVTGAEGTLTTRNDGLKALLKRNTDQQARLEDRVERVEERLLKQYTALDVSIGQFNSLNSYVTQQMSQLLNNSK